MRTIINKQKIYIFNKDYKLLKILPFDKVHQFLKCEKGRTDRILNTQSRFFRKQFYLFTEKEVKSNFHLKIMGNVPNAFTKVHLFNLDCKQIGRFETLNELGRCFSVAPSSFKSVLTRKNRLYKKQFYIFTEDELKTQKFKQIIEDLKADKDIKDQKKFLQLITENEPKTKHYRPVVGFTFETFSYRKFDSITEASLFLSANKGTITDSTNRPLKRKVNGFYFLPYSTEAVKTIKKAFEVKKKMLYLSCQSLPLVEKREKQKELTLDFLALFQIY